LKAGLVDRWQQNLDLRGEKLDLSGELRLVVAAGGGVWTTSSLPALSNTSTNPEGARAAISSLLPATAGANSRSRALTRASG